MFVTSGGSNVGSAQITDGAIVNADVNANAAILASKITGKPYETLATKTLGAGATSLTTDAFSVKKFLEIWIWVPSLALAGDVGLRFNADAGNNYTFSYSLAGGGATKGTAQSSLRLFNGAATSGVFLVAKFRNVAGVLKPGTFISYEMDDTIEGAGHWTNTTDGISAVTLIATQEMGAGTEIVVLGMD